MNTDKHRWINNRLPFHRRRPLHNNGKDLNPSSPQSSPPWRRGGTPFSHLVSTHRVTGWDEGIYTYSKLSHRSTPAGHEGKCQISQGLGGFYGLRSAVYGLPCIVFLSALIILAMVFTGPVFGGPVKYSQDKRFIDNGDLTITDTKTGYMWMKEDSYQYKGHWLSWFEASDYIEEINQERFADYLDWRLPTIKELTFTISRTWRNRAS